MTGQIVTQNIVSTGAQAKTDPPNTQITKSPAKSAESPETQGTDTTKTQTDQNVAQITSPNQNVGYVDVSPLDMEVETAEDIGMFFLD